jgi:hypothetical protein
VSVQLRAAGGAEHQRPIEVALRTEWRMIERVALRPCGDGCGFVATIHLHPALVRSADEQQGLRFSRAGAATARSRRIGAIADCVNRLNAELPPSESIRDFHVVL